MPLESSPDKPVPVRVVSSLLAQWISRLGRVWVEGQVAQLTRRPGARTVYLTLRDSVADVSLPVTCSGVVLDRLPTPLSEGAAVILAAKPDFYPARGTLSLAATEIRPVGVGELLARLEQVRRLLAAEGLFAAERKKALPFLPRVVGLVCGRSSAAERDVVENARRRWPAVQFRVLQVAVQGVNAVAEVSAAVRTLDADPAVEVIVVARGGGSVEDLLPFSNEGLLRTVAGCGTPVVSAIGHESDTPLLDLTADVRASTPTDAAACIVPDLAEERARVSQALSRLRRGVRARVDSEQRALDALRSRPVLAAPWTALDARAAEVTALRSRAARCLEARLVRSADEVGHVRARLRALSPQATLDRGYAVVQRRDGSVVRRPADVGPGERLRLRLAEGEIAATTPRTPKS